MRLELRIRHEGCPTERFEGDTVMMQVGGERGGANTYVLHAAGPDQLEEALRISEEGVGARADVLSRTRTSMVFHGRNMPDGVVSTIHEEGCSILFPIIYRDGLEFYTLVAPDRDVAGTMLDALEQHGTVEVDRVQEIEPQQVEATVPLAGLVSTLTARQLEILRLAKREGYYEVPREVTADRLSDLAGVSRSTLSEHLRKAEAHLVHRLLDVVERFPSLAEQSTRGPGRPPARER